MRSAQPTPGEHQYRFRRRFELVFVVVFIALLCTLLANRFAAYQQAARLTRLNLDIASMRRGLGYAMLHAVTQGGWTAIRRLAGTNPVKYLQSPLSGYIGTRTDSSPSAVSPGHWYFDPQRHLLIYRLHRVTDYPGALAHPPRVEFAIIFIPRRGSDGSQGNLQLVEISAHSAIPLPVILP